MALRLTGFSTPFDAALRFFDGKKSIGTRRWDDLWQAQHDKGFMVAGLAKGQMLQDVRDAVRRAIAEGTTLADFRRDFARTVEANGWPFRADDTKPYRAWRTAVIYRTNLTTSHAAGRYEQMTDPDLLKARPYWQYRHGGSTNPREQHLGWNGLVLRADDAWWAQHYPPNGWGCSCYVVTLSEDDLARLGKSGPDATPEVTTSTWKSPVTGRTEEVPEGITPGWAYAPGRSLAVELASLASRITDFDWDIGAAVWNDVQRRAVTQVARTFEEWVDDYLPVAVYGGKGRQRDGTKHFVGALSREHAQAIVQHGGTLETAALWMRDEDVVHLVRETKKNPLDADMVRSLPALVSEATAVVWSIDKPGPWLVIRMPGDSSVRLVVLLDQPFKDRSTGARRIVRANVIRTASIISTSTLSDPNLFVVLSGKL